MRIAVLCGGPSPEASVSRISAREVTAALCHTYPDTVCVELDKNIGRHTFTPYDVVFPLCHGVPGEDGSVQGLLEIWGIPYVGSGILASALAMDKGMTKRIVRDEIPVVPGCVIHKDHPYPSTLHTLSEKVVLKPLNMGSAIGVRFMLREEAIERGIKDFLEEYPSVLVESFIEGRELTSGILESEGHTYTHDVIEILTPEGQWYDFTHRYTEGLSTHILPADIPDKVRDDIKRYTHIAHTCLGCRDLSRSDFLLADTGEIYFLELNALPGMTGTSLYPEGFAHQGIEFPNLVARLVNEAIAR